MMMRHRHLIVVAIVVRLLLVDLFYRRDVLRRFDLDRAGSLRFDRAARVRGPVVSPWLALFLASGGGLLLARRRFFFIPL